MSCKLEHEKGCQYHTEKVEENNSWNEFIEWVDNTAHYYSYYLCKSYEKIGLLIEYLKSRGLRHEKEIVLSDLEVEKLEAKVKSLKPKEDDEVELIEQELSYMWRNGNSWKDIAKKAIRLLKNES